MSYFNVKLSFKDEVRIEAIQSTTKLLNPNKIRMMWILDVYNPTNKGFIH